MNAREEFVFSNQEKSLGNGNGFMPKHLKSNSNPLGVSQSGNNNTCGKSEVQMRAKSISKKIRMSPEFNLQGGDPGSTSKESSPLGLKLPRTPSFLSNLGKMSQEKKPGQEHGGSGSNHSKRKAKTKGENPKASHFPAISIRIGGWQRMTRQAGDLVVKLYYAKRKLVWEILEGPLKNKMEIQWSNICGIRAITPENEHGVLEIELKQPPVYYRETCPQPRRHTVWEQSFDFTGGQAPIWRRHLLVFRPGILDKNYEKLLQCDAELNAISKKPFPRHESNYFEPHIFETTLSFTGHGANKVARYPHLSYPAIIPNEPHFRATSGPSLSVLDLPFTNQGGGNYNFVAQNQASWQPSSSTDNFGMHTTFGIPSATRNANNVYDPSFLSTTNVNNVYDPMFPSTTNINNVYDQILPSTTNNNTLLETVKIINSLLEPMGVNNINESICHPNMSFNAMSGYLGNHCDLNGMIPNSIHWLATQGSSENMFQDLGNHYDLNGMISENMFQDLGNHYDFNGMIPDSIHCLAPQGSSENMFQGSNENVFRSSFDDVFQSSGKDVFQGLGKDMFQDSCENVFGGSRNVVFHSSSENMLQGTHDNKFQRASDNMFQGANDNVFDHTGNNTMNDGVGGFSNLFPF